MKLRQCIDRFATVPIDGWDGAAWDLNVAYGNYLTYDRFLGPRTFGHKQRLFLVGGDGEDVLPYEVLRVGNNTVYISVSHNHDERDEGVYSTTFLLQQAPFTMDVYRMDLTPAPSGLGGELTQTKVATMFCDIERYSSEASRETDLLRYGIYTALAPRLALATVSVDHEIEVGGVRYEVKEVYPVLNAAEMKVLKRG